MLSPREGTHSHAARPEPQTCPAKPPSPRGSTPCDGLGSARSWGEQCPAAQHGPAAGGPREGPHGAVGPHGRAVPGPLGGHSASSLGAARDGACRGPRATAALTLCLASSISQLCRSRRSSVGPCSCSEVWDSHCSSSSSWCWNCPRPSRAASSWCCRRQGQGQAPIRWGQPCPHAQHHAPSPTHPHCCSSHLVPISWQIWSPAHAPPPPPRAATPALPHAWDCPALPEPPLPGG